MKKILFFILLFPFFVIAAPTEMVFNIDPNFDISQREEIKGILIRTTNNFYFYTDEDWWQKLSEDQKERLSEEFYNLSTVFEYKIYPALKNNFGTEPRPGIDGDERVYLLIHSMKEGIGGYVQERDLFPKNRSRYSNEKEVIVLNSNLIASPVNKIILAHEFFHLVSLNTKRILKNLKEDPWLEEGRADYIPTFLGLQEEDDSILKERAKILSRSYSHSLVVWKNEKENYALTSAFVHYLVEQYGSKILIDSFKSNTVGIESINWALRENGIKKDFIEIFRDWLVTLYFTDCSFGPEFCYKEKAFKEIKITPTVYYLPKEDGVHVFHPHLTYFQPKFIKVLTTNEKLRIEVEGDKDSDLEFLYFACDPQERCQMKKIFLDSQKKGSIEFSDFGKNYSYLILSPFEKGKATNFSEDERDFELTIKITTGLKKDGVKPAEGTSSLIDELLKTLIGILNKNYPPTTSPPIQKMFSCQKIKKNLYFGLRNDPEVRCLQEFLSVSEKELYPEGKITGNFLWLTKKAVIKFQEKYRDEILKPLGFEKGTGYVGYFTRLKINQLISGQ